MNLTEIAKVLPALLDSGVAVELVSAPGRGKSELIDQTHAKLNKRDHDKGGWGLAKMFLATQTPPDLIGFVFKGEMEHDGKKIATSEPTLPAWMITQDGKPVWEYPRGILFLDEFGQGQADVKAAAAELLLNGRIGRHQLPKGWSVVAASNRSSDRSAVTKSLDFVINRRVELTVDDDLQSWENWAFDAKIEPLFISFANTNPQVVFDDKVPEKQGPWCTPRSLVLLSRMLDQLRDDQGRIPTDKAAVEIATGMIGKAAAAALFAHVKLGHEMPSIDDIIKNPTKTKVPTKPDACMLVSYNLAARVDDKNAEPVITYMERMNKEFAVSFAKAACRRHPQLVFHKSFTAWSDKNASLMTALTDTSNK